MAHGKPFILFGMRPAIRREFATSPAYLVYEENLPNRVLDRRDKLTPPPPSCDVRPGIRISREFEVCTHVLVKTDVTWKLLQPPFEVPIISSRMGSTCSMCTSVASSRKQTALEASLNRVHFGVRQCE